jgi:hypothetical protein
VWHSSHRHSGSEALTGDKKYRPQPSMKANATRFLDDAIANGVTNGVPNAGAIP